MNDSVKVAMSISVPLRTTDDTATVAPAGIPVRSKSPTPTSPSKVRPPERSTVTVAPLRFPSVSDDGEVFVIAAPPSRGTHFEYVFSERMPMPTCSNHITNTTPPLDIIARVGVR